MWYQSVHTHFGDWYVLCQCSSTCKVCLGLVSSHLYAPRDSSDLVTACLCTCLERAYHSGYAKKLPHVGCMTLCQTPCQATNLMPALLSGTV